MDSPSPSIRSLSRTLLAFEAAGRTATDVPVHEAVRVCEKLRLSLTRFVGADGFAALQRRAIALARADVLEVEQALSRIGMFRQKAKNITRLAQKLMEQHAGEVPRSQGKAVRVRDLRPKGA